MFIGMLDCGLRLDTNAGDQPHLHMAFLAGGSNRKPWGLTLGAVESSRREDNGLMMPGPMI